VPGVDDRLDHTFRSKNQFLDSAHVTLMVALLADTVLQGSTGQGHRLPAGKQVLPERLTVTSALRNCCLSQGLKVQIKAVQVDNGHIL
jgi:hypothetical protein